MRSPLRRRLVGLLAAIALLSVPAVAQGAGWFPDETFSTNLATLETGLATRTDGNALATWVDSTGGENNPASLFAQLDRRGTFASAPVLLDTVTKADASVLPRRIPAAAAMGPDGTSAVAWAAPEADSSSTIKVARLNADGSANPAESVGQYDGHPGVAVSLDDRGVVLVVHAANDTMRVARLTADGLERRTDLGPGDPDSEPALSTRPDGSAWVAWTTPSNDVRVVRLDPEGAVVSAATIAKRMTFLSIAASPDGSRAVLGGVTVGDGYTEVAGARLAASGPVVAQELRGARITADPTGPAVPSLAIADDGTVVIARMVVITTTGQLVSTVARLLPGNGTGAVLPDPLGAPGGATGALPAVAAAPDGRMLLAWGTLGTGATRLSTRFIEPDGTLGPVADAGPSQIPVSLGLGSRTASGLRPLFLDDGTIRLGVQQVDPPTRASIRFMTLDATAPKLAVNVPAQAQVGAPVVFAQDASDPRGLGTQAWDFGDGSGANGASVAHVYGAPGTYTVKATAADVSGNIAEVTRQITITAAPGPGSPTPPSTGPPARVDPPRPPVKAGAAARIKVRKAVRTRRKVAVSGTIARTAGGRVTVAYAARIGGALVTKRTTAKITKGRWSATFTVPSSVLKARRAATVVITYKGDADTRKGTAKATVVVSRSKRR